MRSQQLSSLSRDRNHIHRGVRSLDLLPMFQMLAGVLEEDDP